MQLENSHMENLSVIGMCSQADAYYEVNTF